MLRESAKNLSREPAPHAREDRAGASSEREPIDADAPDAPSAPEEIAAPAGAPEPDATAEQPADVAPISPGERAPSAPQAQAPGSVSLPSAAPAEIRLISVSEVKPAQASALPTEGAESRRETGSTGALPRRAEPLSATGVTASPAVRTPVHSVGAEAESSANASQEEIARPAEIGATSTMARAAASVGPSGAVSSVPDAVAAAEVAKVAPAPVPAAGAAVQQTKGRSEKSSAPSPREQPAAGVAGQVTRLSAGSASASQQSQQAPEAAQKTSPNVAPRATASLEQSLQGAERAVGTAVESRSEASGQALAPAAQRAETVQTQLHLEQAGGERAAIATASLQSLRSETAPLSRGAEGIDLTGGGAGTTSTAPDDADHSPSPGVLRGMSALVNQRGGALTMRLTPPELGFLRVQMSIVDGRVSADFTAQSSSAQLTLDRQLGALRQSLESHGLHVERLSVQVVPDAARGSGASDAGGQERRSGDESRQGSHDAGGRESRGRRDGQQESRERMPAWATFAEEFQS